MKERLVEAIGVQPDRTEVKRRKASRAGEPAPSGEARYPSGTRDVLATGRLRGLLVLPEELCRVPPERWR